jgi:competence protein ComEC
MAGEPEFSERFYEQCRRGQGWYWGDVRFRVIWPDEVNRRVAVTRRNDRSCVLLIELGTSAILLPGDIEKRVEQLLADEWPDLVGKRLDLLVAAHHGSKTSSSELFVSTTNPRHVVFSAGFNHHFRHPNEAVTSRFQDAGATMWNTAYHGAVTFSWTESGEMYAEPFRQTHRRYWRGSTVYQAGLPVEL